MNTFLSLLIITFSATSAMTVFSYLISVSFRELYKEPLLLKYILARFHLTFSDKVREILAWMIHYTIGLIFVLSFYYLWKYEIFPVTLLGGLYLGAISGVIGIISWIIMFKLSDFESKAADKGYYAQLFIAHVIFGFVAVITYLFLQSQ